MKKKNLMKKMEKKQNMMKKKSSKIIKKMLLVKMMNNNNFNSKTSKVNNRKLQKMIEMKILQQNINRIITWKRKKIRLKIWRTKMITSRGSKKMKRTMWMFKKKK